MDKDAAKALSDYLILQGNHTAFIVEVTTQAPTDSVEDYVVFLIQKLTRKAHRPTRQELFILLDELMTNLLIPHSIYSPCLISQEDFLQMIKVAISSLIPNVISADTVSEQEQYLSVRIQLPSHS